MSSRYAGIRFRRLGFLGSGGTPIVPMYGAQVLIKILILAYTEQGFNLFWLHHVIIRYHVIERSQTTQSDYRENVIW